MISDFWLKPGHLGYYIMRLGILFKTSVVTDCLWHLYRRGRGWGQGEQWPSAQREPPFDCLAVVEVNVPSQPPKRDLRAEWKFSSPCGLCWYHGWLRTSLPAVRDENPSSLLDFLTPPSRGTGCPGTAWRRQTPRAPTSLCWCGCGKPLSALVLLGWSVAHLISTLCPFLACHFPCPGLEKAGFFCLHPFVISR